MAGHPSYKFPFPSQDLAVQELAADRMYHRIPEKDRQRIVDAAWEKGAGAARSVFLETGGESNFESICVSHGIAVRHRPLDCVHGTQRYFSDYVSGQGVVTLYDGSCELWAKQNDLPLCEAENLILSHEFFHILEATKLGLTSKDYTVPLIRIGPFTLARSGVQALSEVGAHAFARTYHEMLQQKGPSHEL